MNELIEEYDKVYEKQKQSNLKTAQLIDAIIAQVSTGQPTAALQKQLADQQKELYAQIGKFNKAADKFKPFKTDLNDVWDPNAIQRLDKTIESHLIREGRFKTFDLLASESNSTSITQREHFSLMFSIIQDIKQRNLDSAIAWAQQHNATNLEFHLHRVKFISLLLSDKKSSLEYAKYHLAAFNHIYRKEIQRLMCAMLYTNRLSTSPYSDLLDPNLYDDLVRHFTRDFAMLLGLSPDSPLYVALTVGTLALPTIIKMSSIMKGRQGLEWTSAGELPVEIPLFDSQRYHSVFSCPISKEQGTEENPPMVFLNSNSR